MIVSQVHEGNDGLSRSVYHIYIYTYIDIYYICMQDGTPHALFDASKWRPEQAEVALSGCCAHVFRDVHQLRSVCMGHQRVGISSGCGLSPRSEQIYCE